MDFYILPGSHGEARTEFAARLCEKALNAGMSVRVLTDTAAQSALASEVFWALRPDAFVPNSLTEDAHTPTWISAQESLNVAENTLLINLSKKMPAQVSSYARLAEVVIQDPSILEATRKNYSNYKKQGLDSKTHSIS